ncbi:MAG: hypothetical protein WAV73_02950 [Candidatus Moraniibacteriota bacterium]
MPPFELENRIVWRRQGDLKAEDCFYPSFYKDIAKRETFFQENFRVEFVDASPEKLTNVFMPLYEKEIMSRDDFTLDKQKIAADLIEKINKDSFYKFMFIFHKDELISAALFSLKKNGMYVGYRAFKKDFDKNLSHKGTISYWGEKLILDYGRKIGVKYFSYGKDSHPYTGRGRIGLPLYKMKTGMKAMAPFPETPYKLLAIDEKTLMEKAEPTLFFSEKDSLGFYRKCHLYYPANTINPSYLTELEKVATWSGLIFNTASY